MHTQNNNVFNDDKCKKLHKELFNIVLKELISIDKVHIQNDAGNKDPSPNIKDNSINEVFTHNNQYEIDIMHNSLLLHYHISYYFNEIRKIRKGLSEYTKNIMNLLCKIYSADRTKLNELKKINGKVNFLLDHIYLFIFNKKRVKEGIIENAKVSKNIKNYSKIIDNKLICLVNIEDYLSDSIDGVHKIKNTKEYLLNFHRLEKNMLKSLNNIRDKSTKKKNTSNNTTKKKNTSDNSANKKITKDNSTKKNIISDNSTKKKIIKDNNDNKKIIDNKIVNKNTDNNVIKRRKTYENTVNTKKHI